MHFRLFAWSLNDLITCAFHLNRITSAVATLDILLKEDIPALPEFTA